MKFFIAVFAMLLVALPAVAQTAPPGPPSPRPSPTSNAPPVRCDEMWFDKATPQGQATLSVDELRAICDAGNKAELDKAFLAICPAQMAKVEKAQQAVCKAFPNVGATADLDFLARAYRAAQEPLRLKASSLTAPPAPPLPPPASSSSDGRVQAEGLPGGGLPVSLVAQGIGEFLLKRAQEEVSAMATVEVFRKVCQLSSSRWFPKTCALLGDLDNGNDPVGLGLVRRAVEDDIAHLPGNVIPDVLGRLSTPQTEAACLLDVGYALLEGIRDRGTLSPLFEIADDRLLLQRYEIADANVKTACGPTWKRITSARKNADDRLLHRFRESLQTSTDARQVKAEAISTAKTDEDKVPYDLPRLMANWILLGEAMADIREGRDPAGASKRAVVAAVEIVKALLRDDKNGPILTEVGAMVIAINEHDWIGVVSAAENADHLRPILLCGARAESKPDEDPGCVVDKKVRSTLGLVADVASADSSDGVADALNRFAEPIGSWRNKHERLVVGLNGYVGLKGAYESVDGSGKGAASGAPVLALGVDGSAPLGSLRLGLFVQVIDIGNVANVRLSTADDPKLGKIEVAPDTRFVQLFAPGAYIIIAPNAPFVLGLGGDWTPELRTTAAGQKSAWHVGGMLAVDVPLMELARP